MTDEELISEALDLAERGRFRVAPNPMVGALVVRDGEIVGCGYHERIGGPHAEVVALREAGERARGATLYVTLEPCVHRGRTPPCVDAVLEAGLRRVVVSHVDPNEVVGGRGIHRLREAGLDVDVGVGLQRAVRLNWRYLIAKCAGRPAVTLKWAMSLDGRVATRTGESQWISSRGGRRWGLSLREEHDAIVVGIGTALIDDPRLTRRLAEAAGPIRRVVMDRRLRLPPQARMLEEPGPVLVYGEAGRDETIERLEARGAEVAILPSVSPGSVLEDLGRRGVQSVLVEGGPTVAAAFVAERLFDRLAVDCAPLLIGGSDAPGPLAGDGAAGLEEALGLDGMEGERAGGDLVITAFREGCLRDLYESVVECSPPSVRTSPADDD